MRDIIFVMCDDVALLLLEFKEARRELSLSLSLSPDESDLLHSTHFNSLSPGSHSLCFLHLKNDVILLYNDVNGTTVLNSDSFFNLWKAS